jgi:hypothetical protein
MLAALVEHDRLTSKARDHVRREGRVGGEELLGEAVVVRSAAKDEQLEVGERFGELRLDRNVHTRRIGRWSGSL